MNSKCKRLCVIGGCQGAGATFFATTLAFVLAEKADGLTFVEAPKSNRYRDEPELVNQISMEKILKRKGLKIFHNINWIVGNSLSSYDNLDDFFENVPGKYLIYDSPIEYRKYHLIICVVDALPSRVVASRKKVEHLKEYFYGKTMWVLNRDYNCDIKNIEKYLGIKFDYILPAIDQELFYKAERYGLPFAKSKYIDINVKRSFEKIADCIISLY